MPKRYFDLRPGESVSFAGHRVIAEEKSGQRLRICIVTEAPTTKHAAGTAPAARDLPRPSAPQAAPITLKRPEYEAD